MVRILLLFCLSFTHCILVAQVTVSGRVQSAGDSRPLANASVYLNNTTIGVLTDSAGRFEIRGISPGVHEIVVSFVSYQTLMHRFTASGQQPLNFTFMLEAKPWVMPGILIMTKEQRKRKLALFKELFLGITDVADQCRIVNEDDIIFHDTERRNDLLASSAKPLEIVNPRLGYRIFFDLERLSLDNATGYTFFYGFSRYEDMDLGGTGRYNRRRRLYYLGSTMHFFRSLVNREAEKEGFETLRISKSEGASLAFKVPAVDLIIKDSASSMDKIAFTDKFMVRYNKDPFVKQELMRKTMLQGNLPKGVETIVEQLEQPVLIDANGLLINPVSLSYSGFWSYEKLSLMLPLNYKPR